MNSTVPGRQHEVLPDAVRDKLPVSSSEDKNIKIWGMDHGDCSKSLLAHSDSVMQIQFVACTHALLLELLQGRPCQVLRRRQVQ